MMPSPLRKQFISAESTPKSNNKRMRISILQNELDTPISPLRRNKKKTTVPEVQIEAHNDDAERTHRREEANQKERLSLALDTSLSTSVNEEDLKSHFETCIKLFMENKINSKNVWNLRFIDYMRTATKKFKDPLQIGSTSLDVSSKVYGIRVDDVHSDGLKLATNMAKISNKPSTETTEDDENINESVINDDQQRKKKKKKRVTGKKLTIVTEPNTLFAPITKLESIFFQTRQNMELSLIKNLCTNRLSMDNSCYKFMLLSNEKVWLPAAFQEEDVVHSKKINIDIMPLNNEKICQPFSNFDITEWDMRNERFSQSSLANNQMLDDLNNDALPVLELDGSVHDDSDVAIEENDGDNNQTVEEVLELPRLHISDFQKDTCEQLVSLMHDKLIENLWAGPSHWKLKCIKSAKSRFSGQQNKIERHTTKRIKIQRQYINFNYADVNKNDEIQVRGKTKFLDESEVFLPLTEPVIKNTILESIHRSGVRLGSKKELNEKRVEDHVEPYCYDNPSDNDYCSQKTEDVDNHDVLQDSDVNAEEGHHENASENENFVDNLIQAPEMVPKTYIPYALQAKKMDMKKLKSITWDCLTKNSKLENKIVQTTFAHLLKDITLHLNEKMRQELTPHLAFTALLHLANEHNLKIIGEENLKNVHILNS